MNDTATPEPAPLLWGPQAAASRLGVSRMTVYRLIDRGDLRSVKFGARTLIPDADLVAYVDRLTRIWAS